MRKVYWLLCMAALVLTGCRGTNWKSSVPDFPVHFEINTNVGMFVNFHPANVSSYLIVDASGYHLNGMRQPLLVTDAYGYAGTVVYINIWSQYVAYDLCCPACLKPDKPCQVDGQFAVCPECGEEYDINTGNGAPTRGISREPLKPYYARYNESTGKLFVTRYQ